MDDPAATPQSQLDPLDPLEAQDLDVEQDDADVVVDLTTLDDPTLTDDAHKEVKEEQELIKVLEKLEVPDATPTKKSTSHIIPQRLIDQPLTIDDLFDKGSL